MQTNFSLAQLADPDVSHSEQILRKCVHCGFCTATCPTYLTLGDELDSPRGRIYLIKDMLENDKPADEKVVKHIDRCLSCLACMTTCPSGVNYMHLVDHARAHIQKTYKRPLLDRLYRSVLAMVLPYPGRFKLALTAARLGKPFAGLLGKIPGGKPMAAMLALAPSGLPTADPRLRQSVHSAEITNSAVPKGRVIVMQGCAQRVLDPTINLATIDLLNRLGVEVHTPPAEGCCGALVHHMGREEESHADAKRNIDAWLEQEETPRPGRDHHHNVRLWHHGQGLRPHAAQRSRLCGQGRTSFRAGQGRDRVSVDTGFAGGARPVQESALPITLPARCSMARKSRTSRRIS